jgi:hypothetical protein
VNRSLVAVVAVVAVSGALGLGGALYARFSAAPAAASAAAPRHGAPPLARSRAAATSATPASPELDPLGARRVLYETVDELLRVSDFARARQLLDEDQARYGDDPAPPWPDLAQGYRLIADCLERPSDPKPRVLAQAFVGVSEASALVPKIRAACAR